MKTNKLLSLPFVIFALTPSVTNSLAAELSTAESEARDENVPLQLYEAPRKKNLAFPTYPRLERGVREGWVKVNFMVDPAGKPYEVVVVDSTGNKNFEDAAIRAAQASSFQPATSGGTPVDASYALKYTFHSDQRSSGAHRDFVSAHRALLEALNAKDRERADAALARMKIENLYEDAHFQFAKAAYLSLWGKEDEQLAALKGAVATEKCPVYLPKVQFSAALSNLMGLQIRSQDFGGALETWDTMQKKCVGNGNFEDWRKAIDEILVLRDDARAYSISSSIGTTPWYYDLLKRNFQINVVSGHVSEIKLRCQKKYVFFPYQRDMLYKIAANAGKCGIEIVGDPQTTFELIQS